MTPTTTTLAIEQPQPPSSTTNTAGKRNLLLAQLDIAQNTVLHEMTRITSRPNRAYAKQWVRDYVQYTGPLSASASKLTRQQQKQHLERVCLDKVYFVYTILLTQQQQQQAQASSSSFSSHAKNNIIVQYYDVIVLLPPDAIITNLDYDVLNLFPSSDKLVGIATYKNSNTVATATTDDVDAQYDDYDKDNGSFASIVFFNLRHRYAMATAQLWYKFTQESTDVTCGAGNEIQLLLNAIDTIIDNTTTATTTTTPSTTRQDLVTHFWVQQENGFVTTSATVGGTTDRVVKMIPPKVPSSKAIALLTHAQEVTTELQTTADSVCYRYYPRCEVL
jgi:hypothetical protein